MIDLHTHTTASDGRCAPAELVARAAAAGVKVLAVTDHDTTAGCDAAEAACAAAGIEFVPGIEITSIVDGEDVHVLGYFIDRRSTALGTLLTEQRQHRVNRLREIVRRLAARGVTLDADAILQPAVADSSKAVGRPWVARALVAAGHVKTTDEAFRLWLGRGSAAFVPRVGPRPADVFSLIRGVGGVSSLAHPGLLKHDDWIRQFVASGLDALEAYHSDHDANATARYLAMADRLQLLVSGGSDYHGGEEHGPARLGGVDLPREAFEALKACAGT